jgi:hypothetical protein
MGDIWDWWVDLLGDGIAGAIVALLLAVFALLIAGNLVVWPIAGVTWVARAVRDGWRSVPKD